MGKRPNFTPKEIYKCRDQVVSVAAVARWAGFADRPGWWQSLDNSGRFWYCSEFMKQRGKRQGNR